MNLFALIDSGQDTVVNRIPVSQAIQAQLNNMFTQQSIAFLDDKTHIPFDGNYNANEDELFRIEAFPLANDILLAVRNPINYDVLDLEEMEGRVKALFFSYANNANPTVYFQHFDSRKILANRGISIYLSGDTYRSFDSKGLVLSGGLTAVFQDGALFFSSYFNTRKFVDLQNFYEEATEEDIDNFIATECLMFEDQIGFRDDLNSRLRKKIKAIGQRGVLQDNSAVAICQQASGFGIELQVEGERLVLPRNKNLMKEFIRFLDEDYFITPLTNRRCVASSKRELQ